MSHINSDFLAKMLVKPIHQSVVNGRRIRVISHHLSQLLPKDESIKGLDVGCGSGELAQQIKYLSPQVEFVGVDILIRENTLIEAVEFDGKKLPFPDQSFDFTMLVDVLHHTDAPILLLRECARVSRKFVLLKDHICESWWDRQRLGFMDWVGNRAYGVSLPYNYQSKKNWEVLFKLSQLRCETESYSLGIYPQPFSLIFDSSLHFVAKLAITE